MTFDNEKDGLNAVRQGAKQQSYSDDNPRPLLLHLMEQHPDASNKEFFNLFSEVLNAHPQRDGFLQTIINNWVCNTLTSIRRHTRSSKSNNGKAARAKVAQRTTQILVLNLVMPNGKRLGDCTGTECLRMGVESSLLGKRLTKIGKRVPPRQQVSKVLDNAQAAAIWR
jgi:hypothetical protein